MCTKQAEKFSPLLSLSLYLNVLDKERKKGEDTSKSIGCRSSRILPLKYHPARTELGKRNDAKLFWLVECKQNALFWHLSICPIPCNERDRQRWLKNLNPFGYKRKGATVADAVQHELLPGQGGEDMRLSGNQHLLYGPWNTKEKQIPLKTWLALQVEKRMRRMFPVYKIAARWPTVLYTIPPKPNRAAKIASTGKRNQGSLRVGRQKIR